MLRRLSPLILISLFLGLSPTALGETVPAYRVPQATDLQAAGREAREQKLPILIMFSQSGCMYCEIVREEFLEPMRKSGDYTDKVIMRIIKLDDYSEIRDFDGQWREPGTIATRYRASVTPTVIFVDGNGHELAERLLGINTVAFYGGQLDDAIDTSLQHLQPTSLSMTGAASPR